MRKGLLLLAAMAIISVSLFTSCSENKKTKDNPSDKAGTGVSGDEDTVTVEGIDLYGTYDQNDLLIVPLNEEQSDVTLEIPQIEGLKDKAIEDKINQELYKKTKALYDGFEKAEYSSFYTNANFANVISISIYIGNDDTTKQVHANYNLLDGTPIAFEDLFVENADILKVVRRAFYDILVQYNSFETEVNEIISFDENQLYKMVKGFINNKEKSFCFSPSYIQMYYGDNIASVKMQDISDMVGIYSKYLSKESVFEKTDIGRKNLFTCVDIHDESFDLLDFGYAKKNMWYDVTIQKDYLEELDDNRREQYTAFKQQIKEKTYQALMEYQEKAKKNPDRFYIFMAKPMININIESEYGEAGWIDTYLDTAFVNENIQIYEMPIKIYENIYKDKIIDAYRYRYLAMQGGAMLDTEDEKDVDYKEIITEDEYNYITGVLVSK